jgi:hypothetical protein
MFSFGFWFGDLPFATDSKRNPARATSANHNEPPRRLDALKRIFRNNLPAFV